VELCLLHLVAVELLLHLQLTLKLKLLLLLEPVFKHRQQVVVVIKYATHFFET
jgi:hypothetical protein